jgi:hypothetical protein
VTFARRDSRRIFFQGGGRATYNDHAVLTDPACSTDGFSTESDSALLKWEVTWKHVALHARNFSHFAGMSSFHSGVGGQLQSQACDPTTGNLLPVDSSTCGTSAVGDGPVTLDVKYYNRNKVNALLPHEHSPSDLFHVSVRDPLQGNSHDHPRALRAGRRGLGQADPPVQAA